MSWYPSALASMCSFIIVLTLLGCGKGEDSSTAPQKGDTDTASEVFVGKWRSLKHRDQTIAIGRSGKYLTIECRLLGDEVKLNGTYSDGAITFSGPTDSILVTHNKERDVIVFLEDYERIRTEPAHSAAVATERTSNSITVIPSQIHGRWKMQLTDSVVATLTFSENGMYRLIIPALSEDESGNWKLEGNRIFFATTSSRKAGDVGEKSTWEIVSAGRASLKLKGLDAKGKELTDVWTSAD